MNKPTIGKKRWAIAEGYIPVESTGKGRELVSHETACILNAGDVDAHITITLFFSDRAPVGPYRVVVPAKRTLHLRFNDLKDPERSQGHRLRQHHRVRRPHRGTAYPPRFAPGGVGTVNHHRLCQ